MQEDALSPHETALLRRRNFLLQASGGLGALALASMLDKKAEANPQSPILNPQSQIQNRRLRGGAPRAAENPREGAP